jgi:hypothetical protein
VIGERGGIGYRVRDAATSSRLESPNPARENVTSRIPRSAAARSNGSNGTAAPGLP